MRTRRATAVWEGRLRDGKGTFNGESGAVTADYSFGSRFEDAGGGSNPEELLAAALASCYSMALGAALEQAGTPAARIETTAACSIQRGDSAGWRITTMHLTVVARVPNADRDTFKDLAEGTKSECPISKALMGNVDLELDARLEDD